MLLICFCFVCKGREWFFPIFTNKLTHILLFESFSSESYDQFKQNIHNLFPVLIDTKNVTKDIWKVTNRIYCGVRTALFHIGTLSAFSCSNFSLNSSLLKVGLARYDGECL